MLWYTFSVSSAYVKHFTKHIKITAVRIMGRNFPSLTYYCYLNAWCSVTCKVQFLTHLVRVSIYFHYSFQCIDFKQSFLLIYQISAAELSISKLVYFHCGIFKSIILKYHYLSEYKSSVYELEVREVVGMCVCQWICMATLDAYRWCVSQ